MTVDQNPNEIPVNAEPDEVELVDCSWCSARVPVDEIVEHFNNNENLELCERCEDRSIRCDNCSDTVHQTSYTNINGDYFCEFCAEDYEYCDNCDSSYYTQDYNSCPDCENSRDDLIHNYSFRPEPVFFIKKDHFTPFDPRTTSVTGFELEMEAVNCNRYDGAERAEEIFGKWCYLKDDGSLNDGFEMVSHPMSREFAIETFPYERLRELSGMGMRSAQTRTCGLHIHINRSYFRTNPTTMYRFMSMFYRNTEQWKKIAGRAESSYATWDEYELERMLAYTKSLNGPGYPAHNSNRYVALNLQNRNTIELRFFKGTLRPESFIARIEAAHAVAQYAYATRNNVSIKTAHDWERFREWTIQNGFKNFDAYATTKGV